MISSVINQLISSSFVHFDTINEHRKAELDVLSNWMTEKLKENKKLECIVICTHNSRRSHLGQLLISLAADYYKIKGLTAFSGGTEATAFNYRMVDALKREGFEIKETKSGTNPEYSISWGDSQLQELNTIFSKAYSHEANPQSDFLAILVCDSADQNCPVVLGAAKRIALPYKDPKDYDDTSEEDKAYTEKIHEMGKEFFYLISRIKTSQTIDTV
jgi:arsenate reductase